MKATLRQAYKIPNIIDLSSAENLESTLSQLQQQLATCESALDEYLEQKRQAFPRLYFVSIPDLLDILSKGIADSFSRMYPQSPRPPTNAFVHASLVTGTCWRQ